MAYWQSCALALITPINPNSLGKSSYNLGSGTGVPMDTLVLLAPKLFVL